MGLDSAQGTPWHWPKPRHMLETTSKPWAALCLALSRAKPDLRTGWKPGLGLCSWIPLAVDEGGAARFEDFHSATGQISSAEVARTSSARLQDFNRDMSHISSKFQARDYKISIATPTKFQAQRSCKFQARDYKISIATHLLQSSSTIVIFQHLKITRRYCNFFRC